MPKATCAYIDHAGFIICRSCARAARRHRGRLAVFRPARRVRRPGNLVCSACLRRVDAAASENLDSFPCAS